jgi:predicted unusual protein kinase regulating ubiquinone biosynthesis (AarF/ABC1/UbiB family)
MMGSIPNGVRGGLMDLFYGVYNKDPDRCLEALISMGVLVPTGDKTAVRRTADFFLAAFQVIHVVGLLYYLL